jgi:hypothetical protein
MILTPHAIIGAAISSTIPNYPILGFVLAVASHYVIDMIPHNHYAHQHYILKETNSIASLSHNIKAVYQLLLIIFDFIMGVFMSILFFTKDWHSLLITLIGVAGGVLPDFLQFLYFKYKREPFLSHIKFHGKFESKNNLDHRPALGALIQLTTTAVFVLGYFLIFK